MEGKKRREQKAREDNEGQGRRGGWVGLGRENQEGKRREDRAYLYIGEQCTVRGMEQCVHIRGKERWVDTNLTGT